MSGDSPTLIVTTRSGVRPLGVRGAPLHDAAPQLARVLRRRLGDAAADLLAEPQVHVDGKTIDWMAGWSGVVRTLDSLPSAERTSVMASVEATLAEIRRLGDLLAGHGPKEETGVVGLSLKLAARAPSPAYIYLVGDRPVIAAWGYEKDSAPTLPPLSAAASTGAGASSVAAASPSLAGATPSPAPGNNQPARRSVLRPELGAADDDRTVEVRRSRVVHAPPAAAAAATGVPWFRTLAAALPLMLLLIGGAWLLRGCLPADPDLDIVTREGPDAPRAGAAGADRLPVLRASLSAEQSRNRALKVELSLAEAEIKRRIADCKPPEAAKPPPQVAIAPPPPQPAPQPKVTPPAPQPAPPPQPRVAPRNPYDNRLRLPQAPTNNYAFMEGCWRTDPFRHEAQQMQPGISSYCFDAAGNGRLEWRRGRTACRTNAQARFSGAVLALRDADSTCNDGSRWFADQLNCQRGADNVAQCSGNSRDAYGRLVSWTVNLHKLN